MPPDDLKINSRAELFAYLADQPDGKTIFQQIDQWLITYGNKSDYPWELAGKRWQEDAGSIRQKLIDLLQSSESSTPSTQKLSWQETAIRQTEKRIETVSAAISDCLAQLRWSLLAIADHCVTEKKLNDPKDIFWLRLTEIDSLTTASDTFPLSLKLQHRQRLFAQVAPQTQASVGSPSTLYGPLKYSGAIADRCLRLSFHLLGQSVCLGSAVGRAKCCPHWQHPPRINENDILIVPYLHETLLPYLPQLKGIITTQGGLFSQGARLARDRQLLMIVNVPEALNIIQTGQWLRLDGHSGQVELLPRDHLLINID